MSLIRNGSKFVRIDRGGLTVMFLWFIDKKCTTNSLERSNNDQSKLVPVQKRKAESGILIQVKVWSD